MMPIRIHAVCAALNEEVFLPHLLHTLYPFCCGISVLTQYDRDWWGTPVEPDRSLETVAKFPDPDGKIHLVLRRWRDQTAARNMEMLSVASRPHIGILSQGRPYREIAEFHDPPDYFLIVDADEFYDTETLPAVIEHVGRKRPRGMRVHAYNYAHNWNCRVPMGVVPFCHFGFIKPGVLFNHVREVTWNEHRLRKLLGILRLPDFADVAFGFITCPKEVGIFHHGCWLGDRSRLHFKANRAGHAWMHGKDLDADVKALPTVHVPTGDLPRNIREAAWPEGWIER